MLSHSQVDHAKSTNLTCPKMTHQNCKCRKSYFPTSLCGVLVFRFAPAASASARPAASQLITAPLITSHSSHHNSSQLITAPLITPLRLAGAALTPPHHTALITAQIITPLVTPHSSQHNSSHHFVWHHTALSPHTKSHHTWLSHQLVTQHLARRPAAGFCVAGAVHTAFWRSCCTHGRHWAVAGFRVAGVALGDIDLHFA